MCQRYFANFVVFFVAEKYTRFMGKDLNEIKIKKVTVFGKPKDEDEDIVLSIDNPNMAKCATKDTESKDSVKQNIKDESNSKEPSKTDKAKS